MAGIGCSRGSTLPFSVRHVRSFVVLEATRVTSLSSSRSRPLRLISARGSPLRFEPSFKILDADLVLNLGVADGDRNRRSTVALLLNSRLSRAALVSLRASWITALRVLPSARAVSSASRASSGGSEIVFLTPIQCRKDRAARLETDRCRSGLPGPPEASLHLDLVEQSFL